MKDIPVARRKHRVRLGALEFASIVCLAACHGCADPRPQLTLIDLDDSREVGIGWGEVSLCCNNTPTIAIHVDREGYIHLLAQPAPWETIRYLGHTLPRGPAARTVPLAIDVLALVRAVPLPTRPASAALVPPSRVDLEVASKGNTPIHQSFDVELAPFMRDALPQHLRAVAAGGLRFAHPHGPTSPRSIVYVGEQGFWSRGVTPTVGDVDLIALGHDANRRLGSPCGPYLVVAGFGGTDEHRSREVFDTELVVYEAASGTVVAREVLPATEGPCPDTVHGDGNIMVRADEAALNARLDSILAARSRGGAPR